MIKTMEGFYNKYLPEYAAKYPIEIRVSKEEEAYIRWRRGEWVDGESLKKRIGELER